MVSIKIFILTFTIIAELSMTSTSGESMTTRATTGNSKETTTTTTTTTTVQCQQLPHDVLWQRIDASKLRANAPDRRRRSVFPKTKYSVGGGSRGWDAAGETTSNQTAKRKRKDRHHFRFREPHVTLLGDEHPVQLPFDVYKSVGDIQDGGERKRSQMTSSRRKRKLSGGKKKQNGGHRSLPSANAGSPWQCRLEKKWKRMEEGIFPRRIQTGKCVSKTCMMTMYECRPKKYAVRVLKRLNDLCYPLPVIGPNATFEEAWIMDYYEVTVACDCTRAKPSDAAAAAAYGST